MAAVIIWCIPGIFGFLAWELRENWRLYAANRANRLRRVIIGSHGESMLRLLRPGFHSGTIPKRFAKLRRAERKAREKGDWKAARKHLEVLHHVQRDVRRFVEREFAAWFAESRSLARGGSRGPEGPPGHRPRARRDRRVRPCPTARSG